MAASRERLDQLDALRGAVIVVMALDHVREHLSAAHFDPTDLARTTPALFFTRWVTHFCAPTFAFLAGTAAFLWARGRSRRELARFLVTRGLWLVVLELTVVRFAWCFNLAYTREVLLGVLWAIGAGLVALAALVPLPRWAIATFALAVIAGHNLLDPIRPEDFGGYGPLAWGVSGWLFILLHVQVPPVIYPLVPWIAVVPAGYVFAPLLLRPPAERRRLLLALGSTLTAAFVVLRLANGYGDPRPWVAGPTPIVTAMSFLDTTKYPPSLLYLLMTLGPAIAVLPLLERLHGWAAHVLVTFGRVPLFFYVVHLYVIHVLVVAVAAAGGWDPRAFLTVWVFFPPDFGFGLGVVYAAWIGVVAALYPTCRWFAGVKARRREWWMSYL